MSQILPDVTIVIPAYNEEAGIGAVLHSLTTLVATQHLVYEIIVVNDGSTDGTGQVLAGFDTITVIDHQYNRGYGAALKTGIRAAHSDIIVITDADGTYPNERIPELVDLMQDRDMVVGARTTANAKIPLIRRPPKWVLSKLANYLAETRIDDINSGLRAFRKAIIVRFFNILPNGFSFTMTITLAMHTNNYQVLYVPIDYFVRVGHSKIRPIQDTIRFLNTVIRTVFYFNPMRVLTPIGVFFVLLSAIVGIGSFLAGQLLDVTTLILFVTGVQVFLTGAVADLIDKRNRIDNVDEQLL
ncbi:MAG: glycosyltransferase family 2 protein [Anaerolineae bacterium]|nr:glycosyltransferase family 2 protein [Anaerolineae bacterium]